MKKGLALLLVFLLPLPLLAQDKDRYTTITMRDGKTTFQVKIIEIKVEKGVEKVVVRFKEGGSATITLDSLDAHSAYMVKLKFIDPKNPDHRVKLGDYCAKRGLYAIACQEYKTALRLKPELQEVLQKKITLVRNKNARKLYEQALRFMKVDKLEEAEKLLTVIIKNYHDTPYFSDAQERIKEIVKRVEEMKQRAREKEEQLKKKRSPEAMAMIVVEAVEKHFLKVKKEHAKALNEEGRGRLSNAERRWAKLERNLIKCREELTEAMTKLKQEANIDKAESVLETLNKWLENIRLNLVMLAMRQRNNLKAIYWLNRILADDPFNEKALNMKMEISMERLPSVIKFTKPK